MFKRTVISLTLQYSALLLLVFAVFSVGVYTYTKHSFDRDGTSNANNYDSEDQLQATRGLTDADVNDLRTDLLLAYGGLIIVVPVLSYGLARRALRPIADSYQAQQQFANNASHELRTPLSIIQGELELAVSKSRTNAAYRTAIYAALDEVNTLVQLVGQLLLLARDDDKQLQDHFTQIALPNLIKEVVRTTKIAHSKEMPTVRVSAPKSLEIYGIPDLVKQALVNLLDNAAKFTDRSGEITITVTKQNNLVTVRVADTGIGMSHDEIKHAFDSFWRADSARSIAGHGLGLTLTRQIMRIHKGSVRLTSSPGGGATATIIFPSLKK